MKTKLHWLAAAAALAAAAGSVHAQQAGRWIAQIGVTNITPNVDSGNLTTPSLPGTQIDVKSDTELSGGIVYMVTDHWAVDVPLAMPFKHDVVGAGAIAGVGKLGDVRALPITVLAQYRFGAADAKFRPFIAAGPTYAKFYRERSTGTLSALTAGSPTTLTVESKLGVTVQVGASFMLNERWSLDGSVAKTFLKTKTSLSTGQTIDTRLDPTTVSLAVGYRF